MQLLVGCSCSHLRVVVDPPELGDERGVSATFTGKQIMGMHVYFFVGHLDG